MSNLSKEEEKAYRQFVKDCNEHKDLLDVFTTTCDGNCSDCTFKVCLIK